MKSYIRSYIKRILIDGFLIFAMLTSLPFALGLQTETVRRRDLVIDLGDGLTTDAQLTLPVIGEGPFPGILLILGGGAPDLENQVKGFQSALGMSTLTNAAIVISMITVAVAFVMRSKMRVIEEKE